MTALGAPAAGGVIRRSLGSTDPDVRAQAIEALDSIGDRGLGRSIARLIEDAPSAQLLDASTVLTRLRDDDDPWIRVLARRVLPSGVDVTETDHVTSDIATMLQLRRVPLFERLSRRTCSGSRRSPRSAGSRRTLRWCARARQVTNCS